MTQRGRVVWEHAIQPDAPPSNRGAAGGVSGTVLGGMANMASVMAASSVATHAAANT